MAKTVEDASDGLEIISAGVLYEGHWEKKYWSSSRGKDRYPYPVGYQAVRTHNGITYNMEILEGVKGPLFKITSTDGQSCSGQTPDIAWESFQKKGAARIKLLRGKRFSCKIDGVEFFGFKNQIVQRLFRELVVNVSGTAVSSRFCELALGTKPEPCRPPDPLPYPEKEKPQVLGKRSRKHGPNLESLSEKTLKKLQPQDQAQITDESVSRLGSQRNHIHSHKNSSNSKTVYEKKDSLVSEVDCLGFHSVDSSKHFKYEDDHLPQEDGVISSKNLAGTIFKEEETFDRSKIINTQGLSSSQQGEKEGETPLHTASQMMKDLNLCAPDTLDLEIDDTIKLNGIPYNVNNECTLEEVVPDSDPEDEMFTSNFVPDSDPDEVMLTSNFVPDSDPEEDMVTSNFVPDSDPEEDMVTCNVVPDSDPEEEEMVSSTAHAFSQNSNSDPVGQDITTSMMSLLLPRAVPLLKKATRKTNTHSLYKKTSKEKKGKSNLFVVEASPATLLTENVDGKRLQEMTHILSEDPGSVGPIGGDKTSIVRNCFDDDFCEKADNTNQRPLFPDAVEVDLTTFGKDTCTPKDVGPPVGVDLLRQDSSRGGVETGDVRINFYHDAYGAFNEVPRRGDGIVSKSVLACTSPRKRNMCVTSEENSACCPDLHYKQNGVKTLPGFIEESIVLTDAELEALESFDKKMPNTISAEKGEAGTGYTSFTPIPAVANPTRQCDLPLSESIICRSSRDLCSPETCVAATKAESKNCQLGPSHNLIKQDFNCQRLDGQPYNSRTERNCMISEAAFCTNAASVTSQSQEFVGTKNCIGPLNVVNPSISCEGKSHGCGDNEFDVSESWFLEQGDSFWEEIDLKIEKIKSVPNLTTQTKTKRKNSDLDGVVDLIGCYFHPKPVLLVLLITEDDEIYMCVLCGSFMDKKCTLFIYKTPIQGHGSGYPSFIGYTSIVSPVSRDSLGREITLDSSGLQLTPNGQYLVLLNYIKVSCCREGRFPCPCPICASYCFEKNAVKIVQVKRGYVSVVTKLKTADTVRCILVCHPNYLLVAEESERLHLWVMNSTWSAEIDQSILPTSDNIVPYIVDLKRIPKCSNLVLGHNGFGEFNLWDISKRILVSSFSSRSTSISRFSPISLFTLQGQGLVTHRDETENINDVNKFFLERGDAHACLPLKSKDLAILLLISANSDPDHHGNLSKTSGGWRQALLVNNTVISENVLDPRASVIGTSAGHGIIGTYDGDAYMWELSTGNVLGDLHNFKGCGVSCIATDDSSSGAFALAAGCELRVYNKYLQSQSTGNK